MTTRRPILALTAIAALAGLAAPAAAQSYEEQRRWDDAQARYQAETERYQQERDRYYAARSNDRDDGGYDDRDYEGSYGENGYRRAPDYTQFETDYDAARDYRADPRYAERELGSEDRVYRGSDGRYYCERSDGTTGLIVGAAAGGLFGNVLDGGRRRTAGTLVGGALGALLGREVERNSSGVRCR